MAKKQAKKASAKKAAVPVLAGIKIAIDPGHGMSNATPGLYDSGAVSPNGVEEASVALDYAQELNRRLVALNVPTFMTRTNATTATPVTSRATAAAQANCTHFVSLHLNAADDPAAHGLEVLFRDDVKDKPLAIQLQEALIRATGFRDRGVKQRTNLAVLKFIPGPAVLIELGFISNSHDLADLLDPDVRDAIMDAIIATLVPASGVAAPSGATFLPDATAPVAAAAGVGLASGLFRNIRTTEFGGGEESGMSSAYGGVVNGNEPEASLPARVGANKRNIRVINRATGREVICRVNDVGPWNTQDDYWTTGSRPAAESQFANHTMAQNHRIPNNPAGLDLTPAALDALGVPGAQMTRQATVDWEFV